MILTNQSNTAIAEIYDEDSIKDKDSIENYIGTLIKTLLIRIKAIEEENENIKKENKKLQSTLENHFKSPTTEDFINWIDLEEEDWV